MCNCKRSLLPRLGIKQYGTILVSHRNFNLIGNDGDKVEKFVKVWFHNASMCHWKRTGDVKSVL